MTAGTDKKIRINLVFRLITGAIVFNGLMFAVIFTYAQALLDVAPIGMEKKVISAVEAIQGVTDCYRVRLRYSGSQFFADIHVLIDGNQTFKNAHILTDKIESVIKELIPDVDVTVHPEPEPEVTVDI